MKVTRFNSFNLSQSRPIGFQGLYAEKETLRDNPESLRNQSAMRHIRENWSKYAGKDYKTQRLLVFIAFAVGTAYELLN